MQITELRLVNHNKDQLDKIERMIKSRDAFQSYGLLGPEQRDNYVMVAVFAS